MNRPPDAQSVPPDQVWRRRPVLAALLRGLVFLVPIAVAFAVSIALTRLLPTPEGSGAVALWWVVLITGMVVTATLMERLCRRLLPLAALLRLGMLFPDRAPSRFAVARRRGRPAELRAELDRVLATSGPNAHVLDDPDTHGALTVLTLLATIAAHDLRTRGHSERVRILVDMIAEEMDLPEEDRYKLRWAALLHDVGKIDIPATLLNKAAQPDATEWSVLHQHPAEGDRLCTPIRDWLGRWADTALHHHERWDGQGYPLGLATTDICLGGRIVAVADAFEVMTAQRPYRHAVRPAVARIELVSKAGTQFDPEVCRAFLNISVGRLWRALGIAAWLGEIPLLGPLAAGFERLGARGAIKVAVAGSAAVGAASGLVGVPPGAVTGPATGQVEAAAVHPTPPAQPPGGFSLWQAPPPAAPAGATATAVGEAPAPPPAPAEGATSSSSSSSSTATTGTAATPVTGGVAAAATSSSSSTSAGPATTAEPVAGPGSGPPGAPAAAPAVTTGAAQSGGGSAGVTAAARGGGDGDGDCDDVAPPRSDSRRDQVAACSGGVGGDRDGAADPGRGGSPAG